MASKPTTANMPLMARPTGVANRQQMPGYPTPSNMPLNPGAQKPVVSVQPLMATQPIPANVQPQLAIQQNPANMQQQSATQAQLQSSAHLQPHTVLNGPQGSMQPQMGVKHTPVTFGGKHGMQPLVKGDRLMLSTSDDNVMSRQIQSTHVPDGREIDVKPLLLIIEDIFKRAVPSVNVISGVETQPIPEALEDKTYQSSFLGMLEALAYLIDRISCEITCKCSGGGDAHATAIAILNMLTSYTWDAKLALALAAFAVTYGEFWLVAQSYTTNQLAKAVAILKQLPEILEHSSMLKPQFDAIKNLIKAMVDISKCVFEFRQLPSHYITADFDALSSALAHIPVAVYWTIRSILACASQLTGLTLLGREHVVSTTEAWELSSLAHKLNNMHSHLTTLLHTCYKYVDEMKYTEALRNIKNMFEIVHIDNMRILKVLIYQKDDLQPLVDGATKRRVHLDVLRRKNVLLLISELDISNEELSILEQIYTESRQHPTRQERQFEFVWLPILDPAMAWTESKQKQFDNIQAAMPWYTVQHPSLIDRAVVQFIKEEWRFGKKPILVVLDPQGRVVCPNAIHMMWIWGSLAFPFTTAREEALWREETWRLELLTDGIDPMLLSWISEGRYICLYGGEDIEWIRNFTTAAKTVAQAANIPLGMVYVGKSNPKERVRKNIGTITRDNLSHCWQDLTLLWFFWVRLESMWLSKNQLGKTVENDHIMSEIMAMLSYDSSEGGWALFAKGSAEMTRAKGSTFLTCLQEYNVWRDQVPPKGFLPALKDHLEQLHTPHHCNRLVLPGITGNIPEKIVCSECGRSMEKFIMYQCCDE